MPSADDPHFQKYLDELTASDVAWPSEPIDSTEPDRFAAFVSKLFELSKNRVGVFTDHLCRVSAHVPIAAIDAGQPYWSAPRIIEKAEEFIARENSSLEIIVRKDIDSLDGAGIAGNEFLRSLIESERRRGTIVLFACSIEADPNLRLVRNSFIVADERVGYRVEREKIDWQKGLGGIGDPAANQALFQALDVMKSGLEKRVRRTLVPIDGKLGAPNPIKFVFDANAKDPNKPTSITPDVAMGKIKIADYFQDRTNCPAEPVSILRTGLSLLRSSL